MSNASFTRDEVILALDVLYSSTGESLSPRSEAIAELSRTLNQVPIHPADKRPENFRNCVGVSHQIDRFKRGHVDKAKSWDVGTIFFQIAEEYANRHDELHQIAQSIRRNIFYFVSVPFGSASEQDGFPEGALLSHLHRTIELRDGIKFPLEGRCRICQLEPRTIYRSCGSLLQNHLTVNPTQMDGGAKYTAYDFITVCPCCHAALHRHRPWLGKENCEELLR